MKASFGLAEESEQCCLISACFLVCSEDGEAKDNSFSNVNVVCRKLMKRSSILVSVFVTAEGLSFFIVWFYVKQKKEKSLIISLTSNMRCSALTCSASKTLS